MLIQSDARHIPLKANSVDAIVTDPPYGLAFMGKEWDRLDIRQPGDENYTTSNTPAGRSKVRYSSAPSYGGSVGHGQQDWHYSWAIEALRVAKPGAHLLAFGGTRTFHRLTCAIEDAGWEIRDCIFWCFGSGFPKSKNVGCKCGGDTIPYIHEKEANDSRELRHVRETISQTPVLGETDPQSLLQLQMQRNRARKGVGETRIQGADEEDTGKLSKVRDARTEESGLEGRSNVLEEARELQADQVCSLSYGISPNGSQGRLYHGAPFIDGEEGGKDSQSERSGASQESRSTRQLHQESKTLQEQQSPQKSRGSQVCPKCGGLIDWKGFGSALKPAFEPIILARKPLDGTIIQNVQKWGTGALNIDGCRIGTSSDMNPNDFDDRKRKSPKFNGIYGQGQLRNGLGVVPDGRWPANVIHDGSEEVMGLFPKQKSGTLEFPHHDRNSREIYGGGWDTAKRQGQWSANSGSAARFFYTAKCSRSDRNGSNHPTMKPTDLMAYLCRLVTPPGGLILDPFAGSGSTGKAAAQEGFRFIGLELEIDYIEIARKRIYGPLFADTINA